ncbi:MAG: phosphatidylglycerol lysyltransferase domain-containing protein [Paracoccaceae bacterium]
MRPFQIAAGAIPWPADRLRTGRLLATLSITAGFAWLLADRLSQIDMHETARVFASVSGRQWALALLATAVSFWAIGQNDALVQRILGHETPARPARVAGMAAVAISQTVGFGVLTGGMVRWRLLPGLTLWQAARLTLAVTIAFLSGLAVLTAMAVTVAPAPPGVAIAAGAPTVLGLAAVAVTLCLWQPGGGRWSRLCLPNARQAGLVLAFTALDALAAAAVLHMVLPAEVAPAFAAFLPAFLLAFGAGLLAGTPGGVGPFEVTLIALLPGVPPEPLFAAILAYRLVYYALPAVLGALVLARGYDARRALPDRYQPAPLPEPVAAEASRAAPWAEAGLLRQGEFGLYEDAAGTLWALAETAQAAVALCQPLNPAAGQTRVGPGRSRALRPDFAALARRARARDRVACLYKCPPRLAQQARRAGWRVLRIADEAVIDLPSFTLDGSARAGLRRKLRRAERNGVEISGPGNGARAADLARLASIAEAWARAHGGERGFSMGRFEPGYLSGQAVFLARASGRICAFASFHRGTEEWALDLMRHEPDAPDGTMQALLVAAIFAAGKARVRRLSLAAAPLCDPGAGLTLAERLPARLLRRDPAEGLRRFKAGFAPRWQPRYVAAPGWFALALAGLDIARRIHRPERPGPTHR